MQNNFLLSLKMQEWKYAILRKMLFNQKKALETQASELKDLETVASE